MAQQHSYAENLLYQAGFAFQPRNGERMDLDRISQVDIPAIVRAVDTEKLSSLLEDITFCDVSEEDLRDSNDGEVFVKLFRLAQLIIEYLVDAQDTLAASLDGLAKKYAAKKREVGSLSDTLARQDAEVATLRDEILVRDMKASLDSNSAGASKEEPASLRVDPSLYPSQERRPTTAPASLEDVSYGSSSASAASLQAHGTAIRLHVVLSTHALCLRMDVDDSLTVLNLKNKLSGRLLAAGSHGVDVGRYGLYHKDEELKYHYRSLKDYHVADDAALVLMPRPAEKVSESSRSGPMIESTEKASESVSAKESATETPAIEAPYEYFGIDSKLEELTSIAAKSQEELIEATRTLQFQVSAQESCKEAFVQEIENQLKSLDGSLLGEIQRRMNDAMDGALQFQAAVQESYKEAFVQEIKKHLTSMDGSLREEIQRRVDDAINERSHQQQQSDYKDDGAQEHARGTTSPLSKLNIGELVETVDDCKDKNKEDGEEQDDSKSKNEISSEREYRKDPPAVMELDRGKVDVTLKVDTSAEVFDREGSPFNPPSEIEVTPSDLTESPQGKTTKEASEEGNETLASSSMLMHYSASSLQMALSASSVSATHGTEELKFDANEEDRTPTPSKGFLDRRVPPEDLTTTISPPHSWSGTAVASAEKERYEQEEARQFRFSDDSVQGLVEILDYDADEYNIAADVSVADDDAAPKISPGRLSKTVDSDLQSIEISHSEFVSSARLSEKAEANSEDGNPNEVKKKSGRFTLKGKKGMSFKKMMPKWNRSKGKSPALRNGDYIEV